VLIGQTHNKPQQPPFRNKAVFPTQIIDIKKKIQCNFEGKAPNIIELSVLQYRAPNGTETL